MRLDKRAILLMALFNGLFQLEARGGPKQTAFAVLAQTLELPVDVSYSDLKRAYETRIALLNKIAPGSRNLLDLQAAWRSYHQPTDSELGAQMAIELRSAGTFGEAVAYMARRYRAPYARPGDAMIGPFETPQGLAFENYLKREIPVFLAGGPSYGEVMSICEQLRHVYLHFDQRVISALPLHALKMTTSIEQEADFFRRIVRSYPLARVIANDVVAVLSRRYATDPNRPEQAVFAILERLGLDSREAVDVYGRSSWMVDTSTYETRSRYRYLHEMLMLILERGSLDQAVGQTVKAELENLIRQAPDQFKREITGGVLNRDVVNFFRRFGGPAQRCRFIEVRAARQPWL